MAEKEEERKKEYEQKNKAYRGSKEEADVSYPDLAVSSGVGDDNDNPDENSSGSEKGRKTRNEKMKKRAREQSREKLKEKRKEKAAEAAGSMIGLPPFLSRFIANHPVLTVVISVGIHLLPLILITAIIMTVAQDPRMMIQATVNIVWQGIKQMIQ